MPGSWFESDDGVHGMAGVVVVMVWESEVIICNGYTQLSWCMSINYFICEKAVKGKENKQQNLVLLNRNLKTDLRVEWEVDLSISG